MQVEFEMELMADKRETLTKLLLDLIDKKQQRADDLQRMMKEMEAGKEKEQENYWLIQYQKLLDSKPKGLEAAEQKLDTKVCLFFFTLLFSSPLHGWSIHLCILLSLKSIFHAKNQGNCFPSCPFLVTAQIIFCYNFHP